MLFALEVPRQNIMKSRKFEDGFRDQYFAIPSVSMFQPRDKVYNTIKLAEFEFESLTYYVMISDQNQHEMALVFLFPRNHYSQKLYLESSPEASSLMMLRKKKFTFRCGRLIVFQEHSCSEYKALMIRLQGKFVRFNLSLKHNFTMSLNVRI